MGPHSSSTSPTPSSSASTLLPLSGGSPPCPSPSSSGWATRPGATSSGSPCAKTPGSETSSPWRPTTSPPTIFWPQFLRSSYAHLQSNASRVIVLLLYCQIVL